VTLKHGVQIHPSHEQIFANRHQCLTKHIRQQGNCPIETVIWRFMSLAKFLSTITTSSLYFCQATVLQGIDPYEGSLAPPNLHFHQSMTEENFVRHIMKIPNSDALPPNFPEVFSPAHRKHFNSIFSATVYINCWHICEHESAFLWSVYASTSDGVSIKSTIGRLKKSIEQEKRDVYMGSVSYIDFEKESIDETNQFNRFFRKRKSFEAEKELRACFTELLPNIGWSERALTVNPRGIPISCDLPTLVEEVVVAPTAPRWYADAVTALVGNLVTNSLLGNRLSEAPLSSNSESLTRHDAGPVIIAAIACSSLREDPPSAYDHSAALWQLVKNGIVNCPDSLDVDAQTR
jgi:hypothetical protein